MLKNKTLFLSGIFALLLVAVAYYLGLFIDLTADTGKYGAIARHIIESGDIINLKIHGDPYEQKPPLIFWLAALGFKLGGVHNWSYKLFSVLYSFCGFWFTFQLGKTLYSKRAGLLAAVLLMSSEVYFLFTMDVHTDLLLQTNITLAIWQLAEYLKSQKTANYIWAFVGVGLAMMSKGPVGAAIPAFALGTHLLLKRDFRQLFNLKWIPGILLALLITAPAFIGLYNQFGWEGLKFFFITNNVGRITGSYAGTNTDYFFYFHTLLYLFLPWTFLLIFALFKEFRSYLKTPYTEREYLTAGGIWIYFLFTSIAKGKAPHYIFSLIPLFAVIVGKWLDYYLQEEKRSTIKQLFRLQYVILSLILIALIMLMSYVLPSAQLIYPALALTALAICAHVLMQPGNYGVKLLLPSIILMACLNIYLNNSALPQAFSYQASTRASKLYNAQAKPDETFYNYLYGQYEVFFYSDTDVKQLKELDQLKLNPEHASWIFTNEAGMDSIRSVYNDKIEVAYPLKHRGMNKIGIQFMNPATRSKSLSTMYLLKLAPSNKSLQQTHQFADNH
jgi:4-amino-4-deoxy-L-arabinose transferase-like glycosyltransferase